MSCSPVSSPIGFTEAKVMIYLLKYCRRVNSPIILKSTSQKRRHVCDTQTFPHQGRFSLANLKGNKQLSYCANSSSVIVEQKQEKNKLKKIKPSKTNNVWQSAMFCQTESEHLQPGKTACMCIHNMEEHQRLLWSLRIYQIYTCPP